MGSDPTERVGQVEEVAGGGVAVARFAAARRTASAWLAVVSLPALVLSGCGPSSEDLYAGRLPDRVDFTADVKPILSDRCFACHGPDEGSLKAGLRLDMEEGSRAVIRPGSLRRSELFRRITSGDPRRVMPPRDSHLELTAYEIAVLARWIEQGAEYEPHWAFTAPEKPALPAVEDAGWVRNPIDRFVLARLEREGLRPSAEAERERLIRRVTYDLTGLPPTLAEVEAFLEDASPGAYERVVDRLLASSAHAERMASEWLDLARYADSHGYEDDGARYMWRWRDWVIGAIQRNQPYDEFVTWQLAGDLLPDATTEQILATGFNRNHPMNVEDGIIDEEYRVEYVADRTNLFGTAFLGLTMECARCHTHKYDPITHAEYYQLFAFFNNNDEIGMALDNGNASPTLLVFEEDEARRLEEVRAEIREREDALRRYVAQLQRERDTSGRVADVRPDLSRGLLAHLPFDAAAGGRAENLASPRHPAVAADGRMQVVEGKVSGALRIDETGLVQVESGYDFERSRPFSFGVWLHPTRDQPYAPILANSTRATPVGGHRGYELALRDNHVAVSLAHMQPADALRVRTEAALPVDRWSHVVVTYDGSSRAAGLSVFIDGELAPVKVEADNLGRTTVTGRRIQIGRKQDGRTESGSFRGGLIDDVRIYDRPLTPFEAAQLAGRSGPEWLQGRTSEEQRAALTAYQAQLDVEYQRRARSLQQAREEENRLLSEADDVMVMRERAEPRTTHLLDRGLYDAPKEAVIPGTPVGVLPFPDSLPPDRLGLARWLFAPEHPLTARVAVNRYWQMLFGTGLVKTADDFGSQGELPSHPELLDWLAVSFRDTGWDTRAMLKEMVTSATYRQSSRTSPELRQRDPENRLLARGPSHRLPAEMIRDGALAASGLLVRDVGGPSVWPYQPEGLWEESSTGRGSLAKYEQGSGSDLYRRSLYSIWKRTSPPPQLTTFDASDRNVCTIQRQRTNTPLQALVLMNDPQFVEAARLLARRMARQGGEGVEDRIRVGFRAVMTRAPSPVELDVLTSLFRKQLAEYQLNPARARSLLGVGEHPPIPSEIRDPANAAALTMVASTLLNLDEAVTKR